MFQKHTARGISLLVTLTSVVVFFLCSSTLEAGFVLEVDISGWEADDFGGSSNNTTEVFDLGAGAQILSIDYDVTFEAFGGSYRSEFVLGVETLDGLQFWDALPASDLDSDGEFTGAGTFSTDALGFFDPGGPFTLGDDGMLIVQVWDRVPDPPSPDARVSAGSMTITYAVPEPASWLALAALCGSGLLRRRR